MSLVSRSGLISTMYQELQCTMQPIRMAVLVDRTRRQVPLSIIREGPCGRQLLCGCSSRARAATLAEQLTGERTLMAWPLNLHARRRHQPERCSRATCAQH